MGLSQLLQSSMQSPVSDDAGQWRQFVLDHLDYLANISTTFEITNILMNQYRYDLDRFLKVRLGRQENIGWIVLLLNNLKSDLEFVNPGDYIIPNDNDVINLYQRFITIETNSSN